MESWIKKAAERERARIEDLETFAEALPAFQKKLIQALEKEIEEYRKEFPSRTVSLEADSEQIKIQNHGLEPPPWARITFDLAEKKLVCEFSNLPRNPREPLRVGFLVTEKKSLAPYGPWENLLLDILWPLLFPYLKLPAK